MRSLEELKEMLCDELDKIVDKGTISMSDLEIVHKLVDTIKNIYKIDMYSEGEYSGDNGWNASGTNGRRYDDGNRSYRGGRHYVRGHYSYGEDSSAVTERIERMMNEGGLSSSEKDVMRRAMDILRK